MKKTSHPSDAASGGTILAIIPDLRGMFPASTPSCMAPSRTSTREVSPARQRIPAWSQTRLTPAKTRASSARVRVVVTVSESGAWRRWTRRSRTRVSRWSGPDPDGRAGASSSSGCAGHCSPAHSPPERTNERTSRATSPTRVADLPGMRPPGLHDADLDCVHLIRLTAPGINPEYSVVHPGQRRRDGRQIRTMSTRSATRRHAPVHPLNDLPAEPPDAVIATSMSEASCKSSV